MAGTAIDVAVSGGYAAYERRRRVINNQAAGGLESAKATYGGIFVSPEVSVTHPLWFEGQRIEPSVMLRYAGLFLDGFTESGTTAPMKLAGREVHLGVGRAQLAVPLDYRWESGGLTRLTVKGGVEGRHQFGGGAVSATLLGQSLTVDAGTDDGSVFGFYAGLAGEYTTPGGIIAFGSLEGLMENDGSHQVSALGGVKVRF